MTILLATLNVKWPEKDHIQNKQLKNVFITSVTCIYLHWVKQTLNRNSNELFKYYVRLWNTFYNRYICNQDNSLQNMAQYRYCTYYEESLRIQLFINPVKIFEKGNLNHFRYNDSPCIAALRLGECGWLTMAHHERQTDPVHWWLQELPAKSMMMYIDTVVQIPVAPYIKFCDMLYWTQNHLHIFTH